MDAKNKKRLRVLISAYYCRPYAGSEPAVGWDCVKALAKHHDLWVITRGSMQSVIEGAPREDVPENVHFSYYELPDYLRPFGFGNPDRPAQLYYYLWQVGIYFIARNLHAKHRFQVAQHVTLVKYWAPSFISRLPIPFVWGPVGGGESAPPGFWRDFSFRGKIYECLRDLGRWLGDIDPFIRGTARHSSIILATSSETADSVRRLCRDADIRVQPAIAITDAELAEFETIRKQRDVADKDAPVCFVSIGRQLHWKGFHLGIQAFAKANIPNAEYLVIGSGPEQENLMALARDLGVEDKVTFTGNIPRPEVLNRLGSCDVLVHPSLHESGGGVCLEGMAAKLPVLALDLGGPAQHHADGAGVLVRADSPALAVDGLATAMKKLASDPAERHAIGERSYKRLLERYLWPTKGQYYSDLFESLVPDPVD